jgi:hypothetical protein
MQSHLTLLLDRFGANPNGDYGADAVVCTHALSVPDPSGDFANNELWVVMNTSYTYWTEAGVKYGLHNKGGYSTSPTFFWADKNSQYGYNEHFATYGPSLDSYYDDNIVYNQGNSWYVNVGGFTGTSWQNTSHGVILDTGLEATTNSATESGSSSDLSWYDTNWIANQPWRYVGQRVDSPTSGYWFNSGVYWKDMIGSTNYAC